ncbi:MAG: hypothetical protein U0X91_11490 [Spirosomataceae bacterium]
MNVQAYIESGIVEEYCLGLLSEQQCKEVEQVAAAFPEIAQEIALTEAALSAYTEKTPRPGLKSQIMGALHNLKLEEAIRLNAPPLINRHSDIQKWKEALVGIEPKHEIDGLKVCFLHETEELQLCVAWLQTDLTEAEHHQDEFQESFLILEGTCDCDLGGKIVSLQPGGYLDIPFNTPHVIKVTTPENGHVKALIQRRKVAA